jgi:signal transduction histidine kinase/CheY-like chemotaxis protein
MGRVLISSQSLAAQDIQRRIRADQVEALYSNSYIGLLGSLGAGLTLYFLVTHDSHVSLTAMNIWLIVLVIQVLVRVGLVFRYKHIRPPPARRPYWGTLFTIGALIGGLCWGMGSLFMVRPAEFDIQLLVLLVISALVYGSLTAFGSLAALYAFLFPALVPICVWSAFQGDDKHLAFAVLGALWVPIVAWLGYGHEQNLLASYKLRYENLDLLERVQRQKEKAEEANVAKSRFLASASHDLRQPVHALGMFVAALRVHEMGAAARRLLDHVEGSIGALDGLFTALLDISRLDAGVIAINVRVFALEPLLSRICQDLKAEAVQKGLRLDFVHSSVLVKSDPVLLERILRNIVTNAVRYTVEGRVLVGCRRDGGLRIQVWDSGPGIPTSQQEKIFEEFFQLANPGRDRSLGLGLGLAIVRRLTGLLGHPLRLKSAPGKGAMFEIVVPMGFAAETPIMPPKANALAGKGLVLVIDDETAICEAMRSLLQSWGHTVITANSGTAMLERIVECESRPDLIICDYRLQDENGIAVIKRLQSEFNDEIPAMLITGDTAPDRLLEARSSGFLLLHKPVSADKLRLAIDTVTSAPEI